MDCWQQIKQQLLQLLKAHSFGTGDDITQYRLEIALPSAETTLLAWLKGQCHYPRFFWQAREAETQYAVLGQARHFTRLGEAQQFLAQPHSSSLRLVGGVTFEGEACFYLPRLLLTQDSDSTTVTVTLTLCREDIQSAVYAFLNALKSAEPLAAIDAGLTLIERHYTQKAWLDLVREALNNIEQGHFTKVVLAQKQTFAPDKTLDPHDLLAQARSRHPACYYFLWAQSAQQVFLGASPERLYRRRQRRLLTEALAGTAACGEEQQQWLLQDGKNIHENRLVVDDICHKLSSLSCRVDVAPLSSRKLSYVQHLVCNIEAKLKTEVNDQACLRAIHPSAAVGGLPCAAALNFIAGRQNFKRDWYAGALGMMSSQDSEFCVAIRSTRLSKDKSGKEKIAIFAGAGIVAGSVPLLEWQEIERKAMGILSLFPAEESGEK
ncbi:hypothetical protein A1D23_09900 [Chelonobacter oris]|uniref:isochorismate synthase n=1 Tax=Chelonobacter oris TaxID=505317 RepID=UPI002448719F|nr:isochorismate synthase [Chelonobacter oris]MDH3000729.1 hypothetical protein [Chelonobacter oris]